MEMERNLIKGPKLPIHTMTFERDKKSQLWGGISSPIHTAWKMMGPPPPLTVTTLVRQMRRVIASFPRNGTSSTESTRGRLGKGVQAVEANSV
ncbi:hypothetical protein TNCT_230261 [Trichonephila clavata]|uniref:Uncharacterized protein n=1 Tax=Trichonephila clavata TaxID=2740835 RepID=A0A8X6LXV7_TRICU|nr:hypothetical protein TNCT_230261 [Trichonephila clavata]